MNDRKLKQLFHAAKQHPAPAPTEGFDLLVMQSIRTDVQPRMKRRENSLADQLNRLFPRLAFAAALMIALCVAADFVSSTGGPSLTDSVAQLSEQWLFASNGL